MRLAGLLLSLLLACGDDDALDASSDAASDGSFDGSDGALDTGHDVGTDVGADAGPADPTVILPRVAIDASELGLLVNDDDPQSVAVAEAYRLARGIPEANVVHVNLAIADVLSPEDFEVARASLASLSDDVQALALSWTRPYRVGCMSITAAFALGFDTMYCNTTGGACGPTAPVPTYDSSSTRPFTDHGVRPTMMLAGADTDAVLALIERGVASDDTFPTGDGYLVRTTDMARSVRYPSFPGVVAEWEHEGGLAFSYIDNADGSGENAIADTEDVLFYFTGLARVPSIDTNTYLPGAIADHLTSFGGRVPTAGGQMSAAEWLAAGVTGSFGTVVEPCNYATKFPSVPIVVSHYFRGETLLEAYWKSVLWPGEGLFAGEPLARPFGAQTITFEADAILIETNAIAPGETWAIESADAEDGPWTFVMDASTEEWRRSTVRVPRSDAAYLRLVRTDD